jgi:hypothetical protein
MPGIQLRYVGEEKYLKRLEEPELGKTYSVFLPNNPDDKAKYLGMLQIFPDALLPEKAGGKPNEPMFRYGINIIFRNSYEAIKSEPPFKQWRLYESRVQKEDLIEFHLVQYHSEIGPQGHHYRQVRRWQIPFVRDPSGGDNHPFRGSIQPQINEMAQVSEDHSVVLNLRKVGVLGINLRLSEDLFGNLGISEMGMEIPEVILDMSYPGAERVSESTLAPYLIPSMTAIRRNPESTYTLTFPEFVGRTGYPPEWDQR